MSSANDDLQAVLNDLLSDRRELRVLEAGCGSGSHVQIPNVGRLVGIDISEDQLRKNDVLDEKILGDLEQYPFAANDFDVAVCWDVLEHLPTPSKALMNMSRALKEGGILVLAMPNLLSVKGIVTKLTPFWFHVFVYRYVLGDKSAGTSDFRQFPTYLRWSITPSSMLAFARTNGLNVRFFHVYEGPVQQALRKRSRLADLAFAAVGVVSKVLSFGRLNLNHSDYMIVLEKPASAMASSRKN
ncbi:MAG: class I SAM-dependent methyltransferase [Planctomycetota bacterium]